MYCKYCGKQISDKAKFCPSCGKPVTVTGHQGNTTAGQTSNTAYQANSAAGQAKNAAYQTSYAAGQAARQTYGSSSTGSTDTQKFLSIIGPQPTFTYGSYIVWGGCLLSFISLYLGFYKETVVNEYSLRFIDMDYSGWIIVLLVAVAILNIFKLYVGDIIGGGIIAIIIWNYVANAREALGVVDSIGNMFGYEESISDAIVSYDVGLYLMIGGLLLLIGGAIYGLVLTVQAHQNE